MTGIPPAGIPCAGTLPAAVLYDFDGLVLDTETPEFETVSEIFREHGHEVTRDEWVAIIGTADHPHWSDVLEQAVGPLPDREAVIERRRSRHRDRIAREQLRPGVVELAMSAHHAGVGVAIASSSPLDWVLGHLRRFAVDHLFPVRATRDDVGRWRTKPHPDLFLLAAERLGVDPALCVVLEDSEPGVAAAKAAGCVAVAVPAGMTAHLRFDEADLVVPSVADLDLARLSGLFAAGRPRPPAPPGHAVGTP